MQTAFIKKQKLFFIRSLKSEESENIHATKNCYSRWQIGLPASGGGPAVALSARELLEERLGAPGLCAESVVHGEVVVDDVALVAEAQHALTVLVLQDAVLDVDAAAVLLTHRDGGVLAVRHALLHHHVAARDVARVDAREVGRLQPTLAHVAPREHAVAVGARHQHAALHVVLRAEAQRRFSATQEPVVQLEVVRVADALKQLSQVGTFETLYFAILFIAGIVEILILKITGI